MAGKPVAASLRVRAPPGLRLAVPRQVYGCSASSGPGRAAMCARGRRPAREIATREPDGSEWSISKPGQAPASPTGTAARPRGSWAGFYVIVLVAFDLLSNFARNSPATVSRYELKVLKLQRFRALLKVHAIELRATLRE